MLEIALLAVASTLALGAAYLLSRLGRDALASPPTVRSARHLRDDAIVGAAASVALFVAIGIGHRHDARSAAIAAAAWAAGSCALGTLAAMGARTWRERSEARAGGGVGEQVIIVFALGALTAIAAAAAHALADPQRLAAQVPEMVVAFAVGCAVLELGERALPLVSAMVLGSFFFDSNGATLRSAPSYASALGIVLFPLALAALGALGAAVAALTASRDPAARKPFAVANVLVLPAAVVAPLALVGWLWQPIALCAAVGATMTLAPKLVGHRDDRASDAVALVALGAAALAAYAVAKHTGLNHAGPFGIAVAAVAADSAALLERAEAEDSISDRQASTLAALAAGLAVLDGGALFRCTHFADAARAPTTDTAAMLAHCNFASVTPLHVDITHPATLACAFAALAATVVMHPEAALRKRLETAAMIAGGVLGAGALAHFGFGVGLESIAAATLVSSFGAALFPQTSSRAIAALIASSALALSAAIA